MKKAFILIFAGESQDQASSLINTHDLGVGNVMRLEVGNSTGEGLSRVRGNGTGRTHKAGIEGKLRAGW